MTRRELLTCCIACCLAGGLAQTAFAQQPSAPGRARVQTPASQPPKTQAQARPSQSQTKQPLKTGVTPTAGTQEPPQQRQQRPAPEFKLSKELEDLLVVWERESAKVKRLRGPLVRYTYDNVYAV